MRPIKRVLIIMAVGLVLVLLAQSYTVISITERAIILGVGIDYKDGNYNITCEVVSPSSDTSTTTGAGTISQMITGSGKTISLAVYDIYQKTGKLPSLGQCSILVLGKSLYAATDVRQCLAYFAFSDAFRDGTIVCCSDGEANTVFNATTPLDGSISFALQAIIQGSGNNTSVPENCLSTFVSKQLSPSSSSYLNLIKFVSNETSQGDKPSASNKPCGFFDVSDIAVFHDYTYNGTLDSDAKKGFTLLNFKDSFDTFVVKDGTPSQVLPDIVGLGVQSKKVKADAELTGQTVQMNVDIKLKLKRMRTDTTGNVRDLLPVEQSEVTPQMKAQAEEQARKSLEAVIKYSAEQNCDFLEIGNKLFRKYGKEWIEFQSQNKEFLKKMKYEINISVE